ncbi:Kinesin motor domain containing protein [Musa troglodytarum]|uniref:Kinesin motor domain containing protein n=1 Tax=Musa troglodytarum TaxID=320322 RepID=A0A9E7E844_9LILI|nr:Kinesin motor domain containing protein [Musa troglodytarum]
MGTIGGEEMARWEKDEGGAKEERIVVSVRMRPLNAQEMEKSDPSDWDCINDTTVVFKNSLPERSVYPTAYTFEPTFNSSHYGLPHLPVLISPLLGDDQTEHSGATATRDVSTMKEPKKSLSRSSAGLMVSAEHSAGLFTFFVSPPSIHLRLRVAASIFAYGQTSSGKTYTMAGVTEYTMEDVYDHIKKHEEREFVLRFSAMEIYNEAVRDLLSSDGSPLRLLDDPETIESTARESKGRDGSSALLAAVNFVDLAGSERASQASSAGNRLKEGCHINRSLLTLGTVIRKLSKGRTGHIPYRDSKLTRILQPFLGGNARTAIICTMSPARSHIEQSRNTLLFASCAKQVVVNAQVNLVMSDKALVKHLQRELARLEHELRYPGSASCTHHSDALRDKDTQIKKMEREIKELMQQRDLAQSRLEDLLHAVADEQSSRQWEESSQSSASHARGECEDALSISAASAIAYQIPDFCSSRFDASKESNEQSKRHIELPDKMGRSISSPTLHRPIRQEGNEDTEEHCKEVRCVEIHALSTTRSEEFNLLLNDESESDLPPPTDEGRPGDPAPGSEGDAHLRAAVEQSIDIETKTTDNVVKPCPQESSPLNSAQKMMTSSRERILTRSRSCKASLMNSSILSWLEHVERDTKTPPEIFGEKSPGRPGEDERRLPASDYDVESEKVSAEVTLSDMPKTQTAGGEVDDHVDASFLAEDDRRKQLPSDQEAQGVLSQGHGAEKSIETVGMDAVRWPLEFERKQREIVQLWHACDVPLVRRTCFFLLFDGDPADSFYMEVECRRLSFLRNTFARGNAGDLVASSLRCLRREREMLCRQMQKKLSPEERESLYAEWGVALSSKQRRLQVARRLWTATDVEHVAESAALVAKLTGFAKRGQAMKEMFELSFTPQQNHHHKRSFGWMHGKSSLV